MAERLIQQNLFIAVVVKLDKITTPASAGVVRLGGGVCVKKLPQIACFGASSIFFLTLKSGSIQCILLICRLLVSVYLMADAVGEDEMDPVIWGVL